MRNGLAPEAVTLDGCDPGDLVRVAIAKANYKRWKISYEQALSRVRDGFSRGDIVDGAGRALSGDVRVGDVCGGCVGAGGGARPGVGAGGVASDRVTGRGVANAGAGAGGCCVYLYRPIPDECDMPALQVLWQGPAAMVINKPSGMATMPRGRYVARSAVVQARRQFDNDAIIAAHRLDRLTSGCLMLVTDPAYRGTYQQLFERRQVQKVYRARTAVGDGAPQGDYEWHLQMRKEGLQVRVVGGSGDRGPASDRGELADGPGSDGDLVGGPRGTDTCTRATVTGRGADYLEWQVRPLTGHMHQIRVALAHAGYPILGDPLYPVVAADGDKLWDGPMMLHAQSLEFRDPVKGDLVHVEATHAKPLATLTK